MELVADRARRAHVATARKVHARIKAEAMARGLMCYPAGGTIDGRRGDHILLAPPYIIEDDHVEQIVARLGAAVDAALAGVALAAEA